MGSGSRKTIGAVLVMAAALLGAQLLDACVGSEPTVTSGDASTEASVACPATQTMCGATCSTLADDPLNCGKCGNACPAEKVCSAGTCNSVCASAQTQCTNEAGPFCATTQTDNANCGTCGNACTSGQSCAAGVCAACATCSPACGAGESLCGSDGGATCTATQSDNANCGACGTTCGTGTSCVAGACAPFVPQCTATQTLCTPDGGAAFCADTKTDNANCGTCGQPCGAGSSCASGVCTPAALTCAVGQTILRARRQRSRRGGLLR